MPPPKPNGSPADVTGSLGKEHDNHAGWLILARFKKRTKTALHEHPLTGTWVPVGKYHPIKSNQIALESEPSPLPNLRLMQKPEETHEPEVIRNSGTIEQSF